MNSASAYALALWGLYFALAFGARTVWQLRRTGSSGFRGISGKPGSPEWTGGVLLVAALALGVAGPALSLTGTVRPIVALDTELVRALGFALYAFGLAATLVAQVAMGRSWRIGVDAAERTDLVTTGPFAVVRNPIFTAMAAVSFGLTLLVPSAISLAGLLALVAALELQVRVVEEPYLLRVHGAAYGAYASRVGRFIPGLGRFHGRLSSVGRPER